MPHSMRLLVQHKKGPYPKTGANQLNSFCLRNIRHAMTVYYTLQSVLEAVSVDSPHGRPSVQLARCQTAGLPDVF
jgi:hypothetical protein